MVRDKTKTKFITFLSPEATRAILVYLSYRDRDVKAATARRKQQLDKQKVTDDSYLFVLREVSPEYLITRDEEIRKLTENAIQKLYRAISDKANKRGKPGYYNYIRSHTIRKYFNSALLNAGCSSTVSEYLMGHTLPEMTQAYYKASPESLKELYKTYIPYLTIQKDIDISESPEFQKIKEENEILAREAVRATVERSEIQDLRNQLEKMQQFNELTSKLLMQSPAFSKALSEEIERQKINKN